MGIVSFLNKLILGKKDTEYEDKKADINRTTDEFNIESEMLDRIDKSDRKIAFFKNGVLYNVSPRNKTVTLYEDRQVAYDSDTIIISDEDMYDPEEPESVKTLRIPHFPQIDKGVVFDLSYILKMRCGMIENPAVIPIFVNKTLDMMEASPIEWGRRDYLRVICNYYCNGLFEEGDRFEKLYRDSHANVFSWPYDAIYEAEHLSTKYYFEDKWYRYQEYKELKSLFPDKVPNTVRGYLQIRTRQTKRFLEIKEAAEKQDFVFYTKKNCHYCRKLNTYIHYSQKFDHSNGSSTLISVQCELYEKGFCNGMDEFGLACVYPLRRMNSFRNTDENARTTNEKTPIENNHLDFELNREIDDLTWNAINVAVENQAISTIIIQRQLRLGYYRAKEIINDLERLGVVGPPDESKNRRVLISQTQLAEIKALINNSELVK